VKTRFREPANTAALIIAGGRGTRFWPASREHYPKPLFSIGDGATLIGETVARFQPLIPADRIFVLVTANQRQAFARELKDLTPRKNLILEPEGRGTTMAIAYGGAVIRKRLGEGVLAVVAADHYIAPAAGFRRTIAKAIALARREPAVVVIGIPPTRPDTGYGYQEAVERKGGGYKVKRFVEKPALPAAKRMLATGRYLWNASMFVMSSATLDRELEANAPALAKAAPGMAAMRPPALARAYRKFDLDSFDRVVLEHSRNVLGVRAEFSWHDVGTWEGLWEALGGREKNVTVGQVMALDSAGVLAHSNSRLMVLLGVNDIVAVDTPDAILIIDRGRSQETRRVTEELKRRGLDRFL
jgi:mannose-1-phosphate guanylyltransferase/mannose-6-phosphate isomerase